MKGKPSYADLESRVRRLEEIESFRKQSEQNVMEREAYLRAILQTAADGFWVIDMEGRIIEVNEAYCRMTGYSREELLRFRIPDLDAIETTEQTALRMNRVLSKGYETFETRHRKKDGSFLHVEISVNFLDLDGGKYICFCRDLTERMRREEQIVLFGRMLDVAPASITIHDTDGRFLFVNDVTWQLHGYADKEEFMTVNLRDLDVPESEALLDERFRRIAEEGEARFEVAHFRKDGSTFPLEVLAKRIEWESRPVILSIAADITERKQAEAALRESEELFRRYLEEAPDGIYMNDLDGNFLYGNRRCEEIIGYPRDALIGKNFLELNILPENCLIRAAELLQANREGKATGPDEMMIIHRNGHIVPIEINTSVMPRTGKTVVLAFVRDITERKHAEQLLRESEARFKALHNASFGGIAVHDKGIILECNQGLSEMTGYSVEELIGMDGLKLIAEQQRPMVMQNIISGYEKPYEATGLRKNGEEYPIRLEARNIPYRGKNVRTVEFRDLTENKRAEKERERLYSQLLQSQKMESVGRLAGGVAHDFNNMLMIILGNTEIALEDTDPSSPLYANLMEIYSSAQRSTELTRQLLAFARKQTVRPRILDLNEVISGMIKMLQRLIGEDIDLVWNPSPRLWPIKMDPSQIDQIIVNLAVNARDAIAGVGTLTINTENAVFNESAAMTHIGIIPGEYVLLQVEDTGCGIEKAALENLFEPFYTTKELGKGTGLGLATIYGIVRQNEGFIAVDSEPGQGTVFKIYLPRTQSAESIADKKTQRKLIGGQETVLIVEDERSILIFAKGILERHGYTVLAAATPKEALALAERHPGPIHLLITDVVMPQLNGKDLLKKISETRPEIKSLYMSGYTADVIAHHGVLEKGVHFLQKPFSIQTFAAKVRKVLDGPGDKE